MKILALETSTLLAGVAVVVDGTVIAEESTMRQRSHSEVISVFIDNCLKKANLQLADIDIFATGEGPGSFTGIRVAANAAKSFAYSFNKPLVTIDTLTLLAAPEAPSVRPILSIVNAYKNMVYTALLDFSDKENPKFLISPTAISVRELSSHILQDVTVVGDGYLDYEEYFPEELKKKLHRISELSDYPQAATLGLMTESAVKKNQTLDWNSFRPLYIRASEAEESKRGLLIKPLT